MKKIKPLDKLNKLTKEGMTLEDANFFIFFVRSGKIR